MAGKTEKKRYLKPKELTPQVESLLANESDDQALLNKLETLADDQGAFVALGPVWGPVLYERNRVLFRPFILSHLSQYYCTPQHWGEIKWKNYADELTRWEATADQHDDPELFRRLVSWRLNAGKRKKARETWQNELLERMEKASPGDFAGVLSRYDMYYSLDRDGAYKIYKIAGTVAKGFILSHLPYMSTGYWGDDRELWEELYKEALLRDDEDLAQKLYKQQVPLEQWAKDIMQLAREIRDASELCKKLEEKHPSNIWGDDLNPLIDLLEERERDVFPYVRQHVISLAGNNRWQKRASKNFKRLKKFADKKEWWDLWAVLLRDCSGSDDFHDAIADLIKAPELTDEGRIERLMSLTGASREWNYGPWSVGNLRQLEDKTAVLLYNKFPELLHGPFRSHLQGGWGHENYPQLFEKARDQNDENLADLLAARMVTRAWFWGEKEESEFHLKVLSEYYNQFRDDEVEFARRAANVISRVPAYSIWDFKTLVKNNRLARLFYARSYSLYLSNPAAVREFLEGSSIFSQNLGFQILGLDQPEAVEIAGRNIDLLIPTMLRPLHRQTRLKAFGALVNAAKESQETAAEILSAARDALSLPDKRYPREELIAMVGKILALWPELRGERERPLVYQYNDKAGVA